VVVATETTAKVPVFNIHGLGYADVSRIVFGLLDKINTFLFTECGRPNAFPDYDGDFGDGGPIANVNKVYTMGIPLTQEEMLVVPLMDCLDTNGRWCPRMETTGGILRGYITKKGKMPQFKFSINNPDGTEDIRVAWPVDPTGTSATAPRARAGERLLWVKDDVTNTLKGKLINGVWEEMEPRK
jgi:hypothetical protein